MNPLALVLDLIFPPREDEQLVRAATREALAARISPVTVETTTPQTVALASFSDPLVRACIREAKYRDSAKAQALLGDLLGEYLAESETETSGTMVFVPMPLSPARLAERGFNQCERVMEHALMRAGPGVAHSSILVRVKNTEHQTRLSRAERLRNVAGAFKANAVCDPGRAYLLFDDVVTTGASMQAAIDALRVAGATRILPLTIAR